MSSRPLIYLDMDGVCCDFVTASIRINGFDPDTVIADWATQYKGEFYTYKVLGIELDTFWDRIGTGGTAFWRELDAYPWFESMYEELNRLGRVVFLSSPTRNPSCLAGKLQWLQDRFGKTFKEFIFTTNKDLLAHSGAALIDDYETNIQKFRERDGNGILFPRVWNANHAFETSPDTYTIQQCADWLS